jgi:two-component system, chemotaxis family, CheB/CheR fusion protein
LLSEAIAKARQLSHEISPPVLHHPDLLTALQWQAARMKEQFGLHVELETDPAPHCENLSLKVFLFRAVQELLFNVVKHAGVDTARLAVSIRGGRLVLSVSDRGRGFDPGALDPLSMKAGFGLLSLREHSSYIGGSLTIDSAPGHGSRFTLSVPLSIAGAEDRGRPPTRNG